MPIRFRKLRNLKRGTEVEYATIPLKDIESPQIYSDFSDTISRFYKSEKINRDRKPKVFDNRSLPPPNDAEYAAGYLVSSGLNAQEALGKKVEEIRQFIKSDKKEIIFPLRGKEIKDATGREKDEYYILTLKKVGKNLLIRPQPFIHTLAWVATPNNHGEFDDRFSSKYFGALKSILEKGFLSPHGRTDGNVYPKKDREHYFNENYDPQKTIKEESTLVNGDSYSIELFSDKGYPNYGNDALDMSTIEKASPERISSVNVHLSKNASDKQREEKMKFYKEQITKTYGIPVRFLDAPENSEGVPHYRRTFPKQKSLEQKVSSVIAITGLFSSMFFLSAEITGNVVGSLSKSSGNIIGLVLFIVGILAAVFYFRRR